MSLHLIHVHKCLDILLPSKSFNTVGRLLLTLFSLTFIQLIISAQLNFSTTSVQCSSESISKSKTTVDESIINLECFVKYHDKYAFILPIYAMFMLNFGIVFGLSFIYAHLVKHRVENFDYPTGATDADERQMLYSPRNRVQDPLEVRTYLRHFSTLFIYIVHLFAARIIPLLAFGIWFFYQAHIPIDFFCPWTLDIQGIGTSNFSDTLNARSNLTFIYCTNPMGAKSKLLVDMVATVDVIFVTLTFLELCYIAWLISKDRNFVTDREFCTVYLLRKRKRIRKLVNKFRKGFNQEVFQLKDDFGCGQISLPSIEDTYVKVVIQEGRECLQAYRHNFYQAYLETPSAVTRLENTADIFKPKEGEQNQAYPRSILIIGRPGIGKTVLTRKLFQQWKLQEDEFWHEKIVILLQFRKFNNKTFTLREMLHYGHNLSIDVFETVYEFILCNPSNTILVFDGLDELRVDSEIFLAKTETENTSEKMPVLSILKMLVFGKLLPGVTVLITSQPTAQHLFEEVNFQRTVEILGFFEEEIKEYVFKFCPNDDATSEFIWNKIKESAELLSLCYIPAISYIVCLTLKESIEIDKSRKQVGDISHRYIPKTITELYKRAIKALLYRHHPIYELLKRRPIDYLTAPFPKELKAKLLKIGEIAKNGISEGSLIFERETDGEFGDLANFGLFHKLPDKRQNFFCFSHLTLQEFLAASNVVDDIGNVEEFLTTHVEDPKWHLVILFVAGLLGDKIKEGEIKEFSRKNFTTFERFEEWSFSLGIEDKPNNIALLGIKCLNELQEIDIMKSVSSKLMAERDGKLCLKNLDVTPVDSTALFEFLCSSKNLQRLQFYQCKIQGKYTYFNMLFNNAANAITSFSWIGELTNAGIIYLSDVLKGINCVLTELVLQDDNEIRVTAVKSLSNALKNEKCKLTRLHLDNMQVGEEGIKYLSDAVKSENCKLAGLYLDNMQISDEGVKYLSDALKSKNCKLTELGLNVTLVTQQGIKYLSDACRSKNCNLRETFTAQSDWDEIFRVPSSIE